MDSRSVFLATAGVALASLAAVMPGQCPAPAWTAMNAFPGTSWEGVATTVRWDPDGPGPLAEVLVVGGNFRYAGGIAADRVAQFDGSRWLPMGGGLNGIVKKLIVHHGELIAGGFFTASGTTTANNVARWVPSTGQWQAMGAGVPGLVYDLLVFRNELLAAGDFALWGVLAPRVRRWDGAGWIPYAPAQNGKVWALHEYNGSLIAAGEFTDSGPGTLGASIVKLNAYGIWDVIGRPNLNQVVTLETHGADLVAGGAFTSIDGVAATGIARWNSGWSAFGSNPGPYVSSLRSVNGVLFAAGSFGPPNPTQSIMQWDGAFWQTLGAGVSGPALIGSVSGNVLTICGGFDKVGGTTAASCVAEWDGMTWSAVGGAGSFYSLQGMSSSFAEAGGSLFAAGTFNGLFLPMGGSQHCVLQWDGAGWRSRGEFRNQQGFAWAGAASHGGELYAGGLFTSIDGLPLLNVARRTGGTWQPVGQGLGPANTHVGWLASHAGDLYAGGSFSQADGLPAAGIAKWNGTAWAPLPTTPWSTVSPVIGTSLSTTGGLIMSFTGSGPLVVRVGRWDGVGWTALGGPFDANVQALAEWNGAIVAAGWFTQNDGTPMSRIARWNGANWQALDVGTEWYPGTSVKALAVINGDLYAGGRFNLADGGRNLARWNGSSWVSPGPSPDGDVASLFPFAGGMMVGGSFKSLGSTVSPMIARWSRPLAFPLLSQPSGPGSGVRLRNVWLVPGNEYFNLFSTDILGLAGSGPWSGLSFNAPTVLFMQLTAPLGALPTHFLAQAATADFGPYSLPAGLVVDALSVNVTGGIVGCISPVTRFTVQ